VIANHTTPRAVTAARGEGGMGMMTDERTAAACQSCGSISNVHLEPSQTAYPWDGTGVDPNRDLPLCESCGKEYRERWEERWADYRAGLI
jgi:hypothetical protein